MRKILIAAVFLLAACTSDAPPPPAPLAFTDGPYRINAASIDVAEDYKPSRRYPHVETQADISPSEAVKQWVAERLVAAGAAGNLEITIKNASVTEKQLPKQKQGVEGFFTKEQTRQYDGTLSIELKLYNERRALPVAHADVSVRQTLTLGENATLADREALYHQMTVNLMKALEIELDKNIRQYFANYLM